MAFVANDQDNEDENKPSSQGPVAPVGGGAVHLAPSSGVGQGGGQSSGAAASPAGGQFATLDKYITANQGQADPLADKITGGIQNTYNTLDQGSQGVLQGLMGQVTNAPGYTKSDNDLIAQESADPTSFANDAGNVASFQKQLTDSYGGPNSAEGTSDYQTQQSKINDAISQGNAQTTTAAGRQQLVAQNSATPTAGVTALNSAILSQSPDALGKVQDAYKPFQNLVSGLSTGAQGVDKTIAQEQADAANASKAATGAISNQITGLNSSVNSGLSAAQQAATTQNAAVKSALTTGTASPEVLSALGISNDQWNSLTAAQKAAATSDLIQSNQGQFGANSGTANVDLTQWLTQQDPNAVLNTANTATQGQYDQAGAFSKLLNGLNLDTPSMVLNTANAGEAGTAPTNLNSYGYNTALQSTQATKAAEDAAAQAYVDALQSGADEQHAQLAAANAQKNSNAIYGGSTLATGLALPAGIGQVTSELSAVKNLISNPSLKNLGDVATSGVKGTVQGVEKGVQAAANTVTNIFCFHPDTLIEMKDGSHKRICDIQVYDDTRGGMVLGVTRGVGQGFYWYEGVVVTAKHAVREFGQWVRVENSQRAVSFPYLTEVVCNLTTSNHRIWSMGIEFADEKETDQYESLDLNQSLAELNRDA